MSSPDVLMPRSGEHLVRVQRPPLQPGPCWFQNHGAGDRRLITPMPPCRKRCCPGSPCFSGDSSLSRDPWLCFYDVQRETMPFFDIFPEVPAFSAAPREGSTQPCLGFDSFPACFPPTEAGGMRPSRCPLPCDTLGEGRDGVVRNKVCSFLVPLALRVHNHGPSHLLRVL